MLIAGGVLGGGGIGFLRRRGWRGLGCGPERSLRTAPASTSSAFGSLRFPLGASTRPAPPKPRHPRLGRLSLHGRGGGWLAWRFGQEPGWVGGGGGVAKGGRAGGLLWHLGVLRRGGAGLAAGPAWRRSGWRLGWASRGLGDGWAGRRLAGIATVAGRMAVARTWFGAGWIPGVGRAQALWLCCWRPRRLLTSWFPFARALRPFSFSSSFRAAPAWCRGTAGCRRGTCSLPSGPW